MEVWGGGGGGGDLILKFAIAQHGLIIALVGCYTLNALDKSSLHSLIFSLRLHGHIRNCSRTGLWPFSSWLVVFSWGYEGTAAFSEVTVPWQLLDSAFASNLYEYC